MSKVQHFNDAIIEHYVHRQRDEFITQLQNRENDILRLAATKCGKATAQFFQSEARGQYYARGSYSMSYFIEFTDGQRCVFRVPLRPSLAYCPRSKLECEVATIQSEALQVHVKPYNHIYQLESGICQTALPFLSLRFWPTAQTVALIHCPHS